MRRSHLAGTFLQLSSRPLSPQPNLPLVFDFVAIAPVGVLANAPVGVTKRSFLVTVLKNFYKSEAKKPRKKKKTNLENLKKNLKKFKKKL